MFQTLLSTRRFAPLFWCQFLSAFNDNLLKNALVIFILFRLKTDGAETLVTLAGGAFIAPYLLFSAIGGEVADRYDKALVARRLKLAEISAALLATAGFALSSVGLLFAALVAFGTFGALFGPIKYGILPDHLTREELPAGNALIEGATFLAILSGTIVGGLSMREGVHPVFLLGGMIVVAALCWLTSLRIPRTDAAAPGSRVDFNILRSTGHLLAELWADKRLWRCGVVTSLFWMIGATMLSLLAPLVTRLLHGSEPVVTIDLAVFAVAIAVGSGLAAWLSGGRIILLPTVLGAGLIGLASLDLGLMLLWSPPAVGGGDLLDPAAFFAQPAAWRTSIDLGLVAIGGGLMIVPSFAAVQAWAQAAQRARVVAAVNVLNAAFMVVGAVVVAALQAAGVSLPILFAGIGVFALLCAVWMGWTLPTNAFRDALWMLFKAVYRLDVRGLDHLADAGPNPIIALNHVSFLDAALALSVLPRDPMFAIDHAIAQRWWVKPFLHFTRAMPLDPTRPLATRSLINAVRGGETLVIFPEGRLTVTGSLMKVYDGAGLIADKSEALVVPVRIEGLEGTIFSRLSAAQARRRWFPKVTVTLLAPVRLNIDASLKGKARRQAAGAALYDIMSDLIFHTEPAGRTLIEAVIAAGHEQGWTRIALEDPVTGQLTYRRLLTAVRLFAPHIAGMADVGGAVGVMLPSSNAAAVSILATVSAGRVPAMINFTAGAAAVRAACVNAGVTTILTSRAFVEKARLDKLVAALGAVTIVYLEDLRGRLTTPAKLRALLAHRKALVPRAASDPAVILFTSGSEGSPKGVVLSHANILANAAQARARIDFGRSDRVFNVLPVFHSFGLTVGLILPLVSGVPVFLYPSPLHYRIVSELVYGSNATILFGTDTFLAGYARVASAYDFRSLRYVLAGAEPVKEANRHVWSEKFGLRILEGYGVTEMAPAVALNTPMFNRFGTVGRILPGIEVRLEPVPGIEEGGRLHLKGPNVMLGYLKDDRPGVLQPPEEGWYDTGDVVVIDAQGFVAIKGRAKRFAKIGGEMISLAAVEALAGELWPDTPSAVVARPDARKGERLVLVTRRKDATRAAFQTFAKGRGAADLMIPAEVQVVDDLPLLGSGKVDLVGLTRMIAEREQQAAA